jgi:hypothetical protein
VLQVRSDVDDPTTELIVAKIVEHGRSRSGPAL